MKKNIFSLLLVTAFISPSTAQILRNAFIHYTTEDGLSHDKVTCITRDATGFLWFGTAVGLNRFDGRTFKSFYPVPADSTSLPGEYINGLREDQQGRLWVSTNQGLCWYDPLIGRFYRVPLHTLDLETNPSGFISALSIDKDGTAWLLAGTNLVRLNLNDLTSALFPLPNGMGGEGRVFNDSKGNIWVGVSNHAFRFLPDKGAFKMYLGRRMADPAKRFDTGHFYEDEEGRLWCGSWGAGLWQYDPKADAFVDFPDISHIATCLLRDTLHGGRPFFWIGGGYDGLYALSIDDRQDFRIQKNPYEVFSHNDGMAFDLYKDPETGVVWVATDMGVEKYDTYSVRFRRGHIPFQPDFNKFSTPVDFLQDRTDSSGNTYWISLWGSGLFRWNRPANTFTRYKAGEGLLSNEVFGIIQDRHGKLWIGSFGGINIINPKTGALKSLTGFLTTPMVNHKVLSLLEDRQGDIWIGSNYEGVFLYQTGTGNIQKIPIPEPAAPGKDATFIRALYEDQTGCIWAASSHGLYRLKPGDRQFVRMEKGFPWQYTAEDICGGRAGTIWVATGNGLFQLDSAGRMLEVYDTRRGFPTNQVHRVRMDRKGSLWVGTNRGLFWLQQPGNSILEFNKSDGLFSNVFNEGFELMPNGELFIGAYNNFNYFQTEEVPLNLLPPKIVLTSTKVMNREWPVSPKKKIVLRPGENMISFEFAALNYSQPEKNRYAYRLDGFDEEWIYTNRTTATYTNLHGGWYTLQVRAANNDGVWNPECLSLQLQVIPPFHRTWYFPVLLAALVSGLGLAATLYLRSQREKMEAIRNRIARDLHDDMGSTLSSIRFFSEYARAKTGAGQEEVSLMLERIGSSAAALSESMQDIIWTINSRHDSLEDLVTRMRIFGNRVLESRQIDFHVHISEGFQPTRLNLGQRRNIYLIFKETVNNAVKYSACSRVSLFLTIVRNNLKMTIEDNGQGFDPVKVNKGNGLNNIQQRAAEIGGEVCLKSAPGTGTCVELRVKLKGNLAAGISQKDVM